MRRLNKTSALAQCRSLIITNEIETFLIPLSPIWQFNQRKVWRRMKLEDFGRKFQSSREGGIFRRKKKKKRKIQGGRKFIRLIATLLSSHNDKKFRRIEMKVTSPFRKINGGGRILREGLCKNPEMMQPVEPILRRFDHKIF